MTAQINDLGQYPSAEELEDVMRDVAMLDRNAAILIMYALDYVVNSDDAMKMLHDELDCIDDHFVDHINEVNTAICDALMYS